MLILVQHVVLDVYISIRSFVVRGGDLTQMSVELDNFNALFWWSCFWYELGSLKLYDDEGFGLFLLDEESIELRLDGSVFDYA